MRRAISSIHIPLTRIVPIAPNLRKAPRSFCTRCPPERQDKVNTKVDPGKPAEAGERSEELTGKGKEALSQGLDITEQEFDEMHHKVKDMKEKAKDLKERASSE